MTKILEADFDPLISPLLYKLYPIGSDVVSYSGTLTERAIDKGSYTKTDTFLTGRYRAALLIGTDVVQRGRVQIGAIEGLTYFIGNWEGTIDIGNITVQPLPPISANQVNVQAMTFDEFGQLENGVLVSVKMILPSTLPGFFDSKIAVFTSVAGIVTLTNLFKGATYEMWRGRSTPIKFVVPITSDLTINGIPVLGNDSTDSCL
jgi:hypothetical protein